MVLSKGAITKEIAESMTAPEAMSWYVALGEANGAKWEPLRDNPLHFKEPETEGK